MVASAAKKAHDGFMTTYIAEPVTGQGPVFSVEREYQSDRNALRYMHTHLVAPGQYRLTAVGDSGPARHVAFLYRLADRSPGYPCMINNGDETIDFSRCDYGSRTCPRPIAVVIATAATNVPGGGAATAERRPFCLFHARSPEPWHVDTFTLAGQQVRVVSDGHGGHVLKPVAP